MDIGVEDQLKDSEGDQGKRARDHGDLEYHAEDVASEGSTAPTAPVRLVPRHRHQDEDGLKDRKRIDQQHREHDQRYR